MYITKKCQAQLTRVTAQGMLVLRDTEPKQADAYMQISTTVQAREYSCISVHPDTVLGLCCTNKPGRTHAGGKEYQAIVCQCIGEPDELQQQRCGHVASIPWH